MTDRRQPGGDADPELAGLVRHVALADALVLAIVALYAAATAAGNRALWIATLAFVLADGLLRMPRVSRLALVPRLEVQAWAMAAYLSFAIWQTGGDASPLQGLYLLPLALAGLVLPARRLAPLVVVVAAFCTTLVVLDPELPPRSAGSAGRVLLAVVPLAVVAWLTHALGSGLSSARRRAAALADGDALTGLGGRRAFLEQLEEEAAMAARRGQPTSLVVLDLAGTRRINELYGQEAGNAALRLLADALRRVLRQTDRAARLGGDEFAILLSGADTPAAQRAAQRIRHALYSTTLDVGARHLRCTASVGIATVPRDGRDAAAVLAAAERRLERDRAARASVAAAASAG